MSNALLDNVDLWTGAVKARSTAGRGSSRKIEWVGVKKLRELILELAVRGKLVPQDASDEPARELLKRIEAEKAQLIADGKIKKQKPLPPVSDDEKPFELPKGWQWVRFGDATINRDFERIPLSVSEREHRRGAYDYYGASGVIDTIDDYIFDKDLLLIGEDGANLINRSTPIAFIAKGKYWVNNHAHVIDGISLNFLEYISLYINSINLEKYVTGTAQPKMNQAKMNLIVLAIPPEEEQKRISFKVDELMQLCDQLEQHTDQQHAAHQQLVETLLNALTQASSAADLAQQWQRIATHFDGLFMGAMGEWAVDRLKDSILQLAVMGKLVPQDPCDEPASELLKRIEAEKAQLIKDGKIKKQKPLPPVGEDEKPFELPDGWEWVHLVKISNEIGTGPFGSMIHQSDYIEGGVPLINPSHMINDRVVEDLQISVNPEKFKELASYKLITGDIVLARRGEVGRCAIITEREHGWLCGTGSFYLRLSSHISRLFTALVFRVTSTRSYLAGNAVGTTMVNLNHSILNSLPIALPPLSEQHRIVAKVDQLFALCDQLKARIHTANQLQLQLTEAVVEQTLA